MKSNVLVHTCNPSAQEVEPVGPLLARALPCLRGKSQASQARSEKPDLKKKRKERRWAGRGSTRQ